MITRADVTFYVSAIGGILAIVIVLWKALVSRLATREELMEELAKLREFLRTEFISRREFESRLKDRQQSKR